jgi:type I restriction enzyme M protein
MLDDVTKRRINTLRQILVGKLPDPKAQVEQITNGLIYKFMNDMDEQSVSMGGKSTYFSGKFQKYSWKNLLDTKTSGVEKIKLYSEAIEQMYNNENLPELFREIFKNSFLPFKDPSTLNMFLKEINEFHYSNSETLGDAFEYLLSFMGSQGDAGQFRTPRHIIDFIVEIVNPQKRETILDPACGTAGFLISSYKYILKQNTKKNLGDGLNASDRKKIGENLNGYDISPDMVKMSLVNMYLHKFTNPKINEYDTLSSEDKWNEYYDVILANPPFFSPKGGITPHNRFGVKSSKAEVLFVDYINEHLKPNGRAGIIVPEGIIFQNNSAYKQIRKTLIDKSLIGVISFPSGIFNPYSGVKTSLLILDKEKSKKVKNIFIGIADSDGFTLTSARRKKSDNDLDKILLKINNFYQENKIIENNKFFLISKNDILKNNDISFSNNEYIKEKTIKGENNFTKLEKLIEEKKTRYSGEKRNIWSVSNKEGFIDPDQLFSHQIASDNIKNYKKVDTNYFAYNPSRINVGSIALNKSNEIGFVSPMYVVFKNLNIKILNNEFLFNLLKSEIGIKKIKEKSIGTVRNTLKFKNLINISIPLPSIETQNLIVEELEGYQKIIDGCRQIIENYKPSIDIDPSWKMVELNEICDVRDGTHDSPKYVNDGYPLITSKNIISGSISFKKVNYISQKDFDDINKRSKVNIGDILMPMIGTIGRPTIVKTDETFAIKNVALIKTKNKIPQEYVRLVLDSKLFENYIISNQAGTTQKFLSLGAIRKFKIPIPPKNIEKKLIENINDEELIISQNSNLISIFQNKIKNKIDNIWSN